MIRFLCFIGRGIKAAFNSFCQFVTVAAETQPRVVGFIVLFLIFYGIYKYSS